MKARFYLIGCGGVGSLMLPALLKLVGKDNVVLLDGDELEPKNLDRQLFDPSDIGKSKAIALGEKYDLPFDNYRNEWFSAGLLPLEPEDWLLVCADNHPARRDSLFESDRTECQVIIAANETTSSEAFYYRREWKGSKLDPRLYYPEIETNTGNDPRARAAGCTGQAQEENRQLVTANFMAASLALHLLMIWHLEASKLNQATRECLPFHLIQNLSRAECRRVKDQRERTEQ